MRVVVDRLKRRVISKHAGDQPFRPAVVDFPLRMALRDRLLDIDCIQSALSHAHARMLGPEERSISTKPAYAARLTNLREVVGRA